MRMIVTAAALVGILLCSTTASAHAIKRGTLTGKVASSAVDVPGNSSAMVYTTPAKYPGFILTQICVHGHVHVMGATLGSFFNVKDGCTTYSPGVAIPHGEVITCVNKDSGTEGCLITGVLSKH